MITADLVKGGQMLEIFSRQWIWGWRWGGKWGKVSRITEIFDWSDWKPGVVINWDAENCGSNRPVGEEAFHWRHNKFEVLSWFKLEVLTGSRMYECGIQVRVPGYRVISIQEVPVLFITQLCLILCNPTDCGPPGSSVHGILQARILEWVAIPFSTGSSQPRDQTRVSCIAGRFLTNWVTREAQIFTYLAASDLSCWDLSLQCRLSYSTACGTLIPWLGIKPVSPCIAGRMFNHWATRQVPVGGI